MSDKNKEKYQALAKHLEEDYVLVHINPTTPDLIIPEDFYKDPSVTLKLSYHFSGSMYLHDDKVVSLLRFGNAPFECVIPFEAIWGVTSTSGVNSVWPESAPSEVFKILLAGVSNIQQPPPQSIEKEEVQSNNQTSKKGGKKSAKTKQKPSYLKRVK